MQPATQTATTRARMPGTHIRTPDQNARMQVMCRDVALQVQWHGQMLSADDWRHMFGAVIHKQRVVPGIDGGFVVLGGSTRKMTKQEVGDMIDLIGSFGVEHNVTWSEPE